MAREANKNPCLRMMRSGPVGEVRLRRGPERVVCKFISRMACLQSFGHVQGGEHQTGTVAELARANV